MIKVKFIDNYKVDFIYPYGNLFECPEQQWNFFVSDSIYDVSDKEFENKAYNLIFEWMLSHQNIIALMGKVIDGIFIQTLSNPILAKSHTI